MLQRCSAADARIDITFACLLLIVNHAAADGVGTVPSTIQNNQDVLLVQHAVRGGVLNVTCVNSRTGYLTLNGVNGTVRRHQVGSIEQLAIDAGDNKQLINAGHLPRFGVLVLGDPKFFDGSTADEPTVPNNLTGTSMISMEILELVDDGESNTDTIKYKIKLGEVTLSATEDGNMSETLESPHVTIAPNAGSLMIDMLPAPPSLMTEQQKRMSLQYQVGSGALSQAYKQQIQASQEGVVRSQGYLTGPLMLICCPFSLLELPFPPLWGFVLIKAICCII